jgi:hypothetical protein
VRRADGTWFLGDSLLRENQFLACFSCDYQARKKKVLDFARARDGFFPQLNNSRTCSTFSPVKPSAFASLL